MIALRIFKRFTWFLGIIVITVTISLTIWLYWITRNSHAFENWCPSTNITKDIPFNVSFEVLPDETLAKMFESGMKNGLYEETICPSQRHQIALVVPYRERPTHLQQFLLNLHKFLRQQHILFVIYIVEQTGNSTFNRGKLMNVGFQVASNQTDCDCYAFHDVDMFPENLANIYQCSTQRPRHLSLQIDKTYKKYVTYPLNFGGVSLLTRSQVVKSNGFSNDFWGYGGEDDEFRSRLVLSGFRIESPTVSVGSYKMIPHVRETENPTNPCRFKLWNSVRKRFAKDGLNSLNYTVIKQENKLLYRWILVDLHEYEGRQKLKNEGIC